MGHYKKMDEPKVIATAGIEQVGGDNNWHHLETRHQPGWPACPSSWTRTQPLLLYRSNVIGASTIVKAENLSLYFGSSDSFPLNQRPEYMGLCSYEVSIRALGDTIEMSSTPAVDLEARSNTDTKGGDCTPNLCVNPGIVMEYAV